MKRIQLLRLTFGRYWTDPCNTAPREVNELVAYLTEHCCGGEACTPLCHPQIMPARTRKTRAA